ncbi:hypothetical protein QBC47DRAFT_185055 [Echria macrotheca]|uniref:Chitin deacetylase n=1 Tax=Echria macrotheca TaxID=438768 RepID=A0AAJ0FCP5_9PEZI|nr:hypothetical protein QBC47DRAFT_185055 [Echria macrotheca]
MRSSGTLIALTAAVLASSPLVAAHSHRLDDAHHLRLGKRAGSGGKCGPSAGNAVCDQGLCCSEDGVCGTGGEYCSAPACQLSYGPACDGNQKPTGADTSKTPRPRFGNVPYGVDITSCTVKGKMALTFDDGPYIYTSELLDLLKKNDVRATFFIVGNNGAKGQINDPSSGYVPIVQRMISDGHQVGSHSWSHADLELSTAEQRTSEIVNNEIAIASILGVIPTYFRPPYTSCGSACYDALNSFGYHVVNYDVDPKDWEDGGVKAEEIFSGIVMPSNPANSAFITLSHDIQPFTVHGFAQYMIDMAREKGFEFVTVGECLGDPAGNWYRDPSTGAAKAAGSGPATPPQRIETTSSSSVAPSTKSSSAEPSTSTSATVTPKPVPSGTDFGLGKNNNSSRSSTSTSASPTLSSSTSAPTSTSPAAGSAGSRVAVGTGVLGGNVVLGLLLGFFGLLFFSLN